MQMNVAALAAKCLLITAAVPLYCSSWLTQLPGAQTFQNNNKKIFFSSTSSSSSTALNGIKGFRSWFDLSFPNAMTELENDYNSQEFDHVLVDMNQLLHVSLRRARNEDHGLTLMIKKLDSYLALAKPQQSLVLAFDGPPSAAKMATQRKRRLGIFLRSNRTDSGSSVNSTSMAGGRYGGLEPLNNIRRKRNRLKEGATLCITPGTKFMKKAKEAMLYWAWQRMSNRYSPLGPSKRVRVYISSSDVPGEGEVKLLDWLFHCSPLLTNGNSTKKRPSIAILGGDSDLVLEALVLPPHLAHDVFVILPHEHRRSIVVSLWETTRYLMSFLTPSHVDLKHITSLRTDLVLLFILNGNDYLSKIRGSSGFQKLLSTYLKLLQRWTAPDTQHKENNLPFLLTPSLDFNIPFCIAFFRELAKQAPTMATIHDDPIIPYEKTVTPLSVLYQLIDSGYLPRPATFHLHKSDKSSHQLVTLTLGEKAQYRYELDYPIQSPLKVAKHQLAEEALQNILQINYTDFAEEDINTSPAYPWEISHLAESHIPSYLYGLLWNLQTYKDGVCTDYAYNYGKRLSPTAGQIVSFFKNISSVNDTIHLGREQLQWNDDTTNSFSPPLDAGLSSIAALPSQAKDLISHPYSLLLENSTLIESLYADCMDPKHNVFNLPLFQKECTQALNSILEERNATTLTKRYQTKKRKQKHNSKNSNQNHYQKKVGRSIHTSAECWTVFSHSRKALEHPFAPPPPFCDGLSNLRSNKFLRVSRRLAASEPSLIPNRVTKYHKNANFLFSDHTLYDLPYLKAFSNGTIADAHAVPLTTIKKKKHRISSTEKQMLPVKSHITTKNEIEPSQSVAIKEPQSIVSTGGRSALSCLYCLLDANSLSPISDLSFEIQPHSSYEVIRLILLSDTNKKSKITFHMNRDLNHVSRKVIKQNLASLVLIHLFGSEWMGVSLKRMKNILKQSYDT